MEKDDEHDQSYHDVKLLHFKNYHWNKSKRKISIAAFCILTFIIGLSAMIFTNPAPIRIILHTQIFL